MHWLTFGISGQVIRYSSNKPIYPYSYFFLKETQTNGILNYPLVYLHPFLYFYAMIRPASLLDKAKALRKCAILRGRYVRKPFRFVRGGRASCFLPQTINMKVMQNTFEEELNAVIQDHIAIRGAGQYGFVHERELIELQTRCIVAIERASGQKSFYYKKAIENTSKDAHKSLSLQIGVATALLRNIQNGYLTGLEETIHRDIFDDFLEMSAYLVGQGYKDPAAVMAGSTLEIHLRKLCDKNDIETTKPNGEPKKNNLLNQELAQEGVYTKSDLKSVTAWLDIRNNAAHGHPEEYTKEQVELMIDGVRNFIVRHPA